MERFKAYKLTETPERKIRAEFVDMTLDDLDPGDVVIRVAYSDVNYKDALAPRARKILRRASCVGGIDLAGTVVSSENGSSRKAMPSSVSASTLASRTTAAMRNTRVPAGWLTKLPQGLTLWDAMAFGTAGYTAGIAIVRMEHEGLKPSSGPVLVNGATGGVGSIAVASLARLGYHVVALTGKESEADWLKKLGAKEILLRKTLNLEKIKPLDKSTWAGAVDSLGGDVLSWICSTMKDNGVIASIGLAASPNLNTTVMPFILRGARLLGINSGESSNDVRDTVWRRLATDMKPPLLKEMARTVPFSKLPTVFDDFINARVTRRVVVDLEE